MTLFFCKNCKSFTYHKNSNYGYCSKSKQDVYENTTWCDSEGVLDPELWFLKEPHISHYLKLEEETDVKILPGHLDREYYKRKLNL